MNRGNGITGLLADRSNPGRGNGPGLLGKGSAENFKGALVNRGREKDKFEDGGIAGPLAERVDPVRGRGLSPLEVEGTGNLCCAIVDISPADRGKIGPEPRDSGPLADRSNPAEGVADGEAEIGVETSDLELADSGENMRRERTSKVEGDGVSLEGKRGALGAADAIWCWRKKAFKFKCGPSPSGDVWRTLSGEGFSVGKGRRLSPLRKGATADGFVEKDDCATDSLCDEEVAEELGKDINTINLIEET